MSQKWEGGIHILQRCCLSIVAVDCKLGGTKGCKKGCKRGGQKDAKGYKRIQNKSWKDLTNETSMTCATPMSSLIRDCLASVAVPLVAFPQSNMAACVGQKLLITNQRPSNWRVVITCLTTHVNTTHSCKSQRYSLLEYYTIHAPQLVHARNPDHWL